MKKLFYLFVALMISHNLLAVDKTWTGTTSTNWATASNWSPSGVPMATDQVIIDNVTNDPVILSGTTATCLGVIVNSSGSLTLNSGGTLNITNTTVPSAVRLNSSATITNNGAVNISSSTSGVYGIELLSSSSFNNSGSVTVNVIDRSVFLTGNGSSFTNNSTGVLNLQGSGTGILYSGSGWTNQTFNNQGTINYSGSGYALNGQSGTGHAFTNAGTFNITGGIGITSAGLPITNNACGKIIMTAGSFFNIGNTTTNNGLIQITGMLSNSTFSGSVFSNSSGGVLKYGTINGSITNNNGSVIVNNTPTPIFTYSGTFTGTVNGIFTNAAATTSAGTFTAPNTFTPSGLPSGSQTLYAKITPSGGACNYVVPFTYNNVVPPTLTVGAVTNATTCGGANGSIAFTTTNVPNGTYSLTFTTTGTSSPQNVAVSNNAFTLSGLSAGSYNNFSLTVSGQTASTGTLSPAKTVANPPTPTLTVGTATNPTTCAGANGSIAFTSTNLPNGTYSLSFTATGAGATTSPQSIMVSGNAFTLSGLKAGAYSNFSVTNAGCTGSVSTSRTLTDPATPTLSILIGLSPTSCGGSNGSIFFSSTNLAIGTYSLSFTATGTGATTSPQNVTASTNSFTLNGLKAGSYSNFSVTANNCTGTLATVRTLTDPNPPTLSVGTAVNPTTCAGTNGSIPFTTTNLPNGTYSLSFTATGVGATTSPQSITVSNNTFTLGGLKAGVYSNFSVTNAGCTGSVSTSRTLTDPATPTLTVGTATNPTTCAGTNGSIAFTSTNLPNGMYSLSFTPTGAGATTSPQSITVSGNAFSLTGLKAGTYSAFSVTSNGCTGTVATSRTLTDPATPTITAGTVLNPATCGATGSIPFTSTNLPNGTYSLSFTPTGAGATTGPRNVTVSGNSFSLTGLSVGSYSNFLLISTGCTASDATSKSIANPTIPTLTPGVAVNPTVCGGTDGSIPFTSNLPDGTYSMSFTGPGSPKSITVNSGAFTLGSLGPGGYSNFSVINNGCTGTSNVSRSLSDPAAPVLTLGTTANPTACNLSDGSIAFTVTNITDGSYSLTYTGAGSPKNVTVTSSAFTLTGLADGTYSNFSITNGSGCTGSLSTPVTLVDLALPVLTVGTATNPTTCSGMDGTIAFTTANLPDGAYSLSFTTTGTASPKNIAVASNSFTLSGLSAGTYSNFSVTRLGCTGTVATSRILSNPASPTITAGTPTNPTTCSGTDGTIAFTTTNLSNGTYSLSFTTTGTSSPKSVIVTNNAFTLTGLSAGNYGSFSLTNNGCTAMDEPTITLSNPASPTITAGLVTAPTSCSSADGSIAFGCTNLSNGSYTITYTGAGSPKTVTIINNAFSLTGLDDGTYSNFSITNLGCTATNATSKTVINPTPPTLTAGTAANPTTCLSTDGSIAFTTTLPDGTYTLNYTGAGNPQTVTVASGAFTLTGLSAGTFSGFSITNAGCTSTDAGSKTVSDPAAPTLTAGTATNPTTCASTDGSIAFTTSLPNGTYTLNYTGSGSPKSITVTGGAFNLTGLPDGTFSGFSVTTGGCTGIDNASKTLTDPAAPTLTAGTATNPTTCASTDGSIAFTTSLPNGTYSLSYTGSGSPKSITVASGAFNLTGLPDGTFSGFSVTTGGCTGIDNASKTLTDPAAPTLTAGTATNPTTCSGTNGSIDFITTLPNGTYTLNYTGSGSPKSINVVSGSFTLTGLSVGTYNGFSVAAGGCTGNDNTTKTLSDPVTPSITAGTVTNPTTCAEADGSIAFTSTNLPNGTYSLSFTGTSSPISITVASNAFSLTGLSAGVYSGFSLTNAGCTAIDATSKTLTAPVAPTLVAGTVTNPSTCGGTDGSIAFTTNLPDGTYSINYTGAGSPKSVTVSSGSFTLTGLSAGTYSGFSVTVAGCIGSDMTTKTITESAAPVLFAVTGGGLYCFGRTGVTVSLSSSELGINYQLKRDGVNTGSPVAGTGTGIVFANQTVSGVYTVEATHSVAGCRATMMGSATVVVNTKPIITLSVNEQSILEGSEQALCDNDLNPVNSLQFAVSTACVVGSPVWRSQVGNGAWSDWSTTPPITQLSNNQPHRYQAACDANCPTTYTNAISVTINYRASTPQNVSMIADGTTVAAGEEKSICDQSGNALTFNATCATGERLLYSVDGGVYLPTIPSQIVDGQFHNYRVRCQKTDGTASCVEPESGVMRLKISAIAAAPVASLNVTSGCGTPSSFSGTANCGSLSTVWYNATTNVALPNLPTTTPNETTSYYARCQGEAGCQSGVSNTVTFTVVPVNTAPSITVSSDLVCTGVLVTVSANCPAGSTAFWNTGVTTNSFQVAFNSVTTQVYSARCVFENGCQSSVSATKTVSWKAFELTIINIGQSKSAIKTNDRAAWASQFVTPDGGPSLDNSTESNPTLYFSENVNKTGPRYWTIHADACALGTAGSLTFDMLLRPETGVAQSFNTHENNAPYFMYANRDGYTELYAQNHPAYGFYLDNGAGGNVYDAGLPKGLYKLGIRYWDQKGQGSIYPSTRQPAGNVLVYQEYWFRIQSKDGVGVGAARVAADLDSYGMTKGAFAQVMPNPVSNVLRLKVTEAKNKKVNISLIDASGRMLLQRGFVPETNQHQEEFEVSELANGMYFLRVNAGEKQATLKVVKVE